MTSEDYHRLRDLLADAVGNKPAWCARALAELRRPLACPRPTLTRSRPAADDGDPT